MIGPESKLVKSGLSKKKDGGSTHSRIYWGKGKLSFVSLNEELNALEESRQGEALPAEGTKERILREALKLFSTDGYEGVSMRRIARAVGIKESSLYKHFAGKQEIFDTLLAEMNRRYRSLEASMGMKGEAVPDAGLYGGIGTDQLAERSVELFLYYLHDDYAAKFRRMLTIEQYRSNEAGEAFRRVFLDAPLRYQAELFSLLSASGGFAAEDAEAAALHFYAPLFLLLCQYDNQPEREAEALEQVRRHVRQFYRLYAGRGQGL